MRLRSGRRAECGPTGCAAVGGPATGRCVLVGACLGAAGGAGRTASRGWRALFAGAVAPRLGGRGVSSAQRPAGEPLRRSARCDAAAPYPPAARADGSLVARGDRARGRGGGCVGMAQIRHGAARRRRWRFSVGTGHKPATADRDDTHRVANLIATTTSATRLPPTPIPARTPRPSQPHPGIDAVLRAQGRGLIPRPVESSHAHVVLRACPTLTAVRVQARRDPARRSTCSLDQTNPASRSTTTHAHAASRTPHTAENVPSAASTSDASDRQRAMCPLRLRRQCGRAGAGAGAAPRTGLIGAWHGCSARGHRSGASWRGPVDASARRPAMAMGRRLRRGLAHGVGRDAACGGVGGIETGASARCRDSRRRRILEQREGLQVSTRAAHQIG